MIASVRAASAAARSDMPEERATCAAISPIEEAISSLAEATIWTLADICSAALATLADCSVVVEAERAMPCAVASISLAAEARARERPETSASKLAVA